MMESIYPQRGGIHEQVYLLYNELTKIQDNIEVKIIPYSTRKAEENGKKLLWLRQLSPGFISKIVSEKFDVIISETAWPIIPSLISSKRLKSKCILHLHSVESKQDVGLSKMGKTIISIFESFSKYCDIILVPSKIEASLIKNKTVIFPNVIDVESFEKESPINLKKPAIVFVGGMGYPPNREAAEIIIRIAEKIKTKTKKNMNFYLVGPSPPEVSEPVYTTGYVRSTIPYILGADICIAPLRRGGGVKLKILEYMAAGKPIIATREAVKGIDEIKYINAETEDEFIEAILDILDNRVNIDFTKNKDIVMENHNPKIQAKKLIDLVNKLNI
ncbi:glycosyltransferase family 4 protein [Acidianus manzaensis]|uniref:Glycosyl transferase n=1 Tax=Acidianus manzaensis TaxID=282676 RepID=A0A1W6K3G9_9CREN|nr:glycosyltransferase family 4 protein [Acidianus manzaensis]ARM76992.1 glycosyl transferase [Acidianus manzaensis]